METRKNVWAVIRGIIAAIGGALGWFLGGGDGMLYALAAFVVIDYLTCLMCAVSDKDWASHAGLKVLAQKVLIFVMVAVGYILDAHVVGEGSAFRMAAIFFYISSEGVSLLGNAAYVGLPFPDKLKDILLTISADYSKNG